MYAFANFLIIFLHVCYPHNKIFSYIKKPDIFFFWFLVLVKAFCTLLSQFLMDFHFKILMYHYPGCYIGGNCIILSLHIFCKWTGPGWILAIGAKISSRYIIIIGLWFIKLHVTSHQRQQFVCFSKRHRLLQRNGLLDVMSDLCCFSLYIFQSKMLKCILFLGASLYIFRGIGLQAVCNFFTQSNAYYFIGVLIPVILKYISK